MALPVRQNLKFNMPGLQHQLFKIHFIIAEASLCLRPRGGIGVRQSVGAVTAADTPSAAACAGLQQHRIAHPLRSGQSVLYGVHRAIGAGRYRDTGNAHQLPRGGFGTGPPNGIPGGTNERDAVFPAGVGKVGVFGQKTVAGMQTVAAGGQCGREQCVFIEIAVRRPGGTNTYGLRCQLHRQRLGVCL